MTLENATPRNGATVNPGEQVVRAMDIECRFCDDGLALVGDQFVPCPACNALSVAMELRDPHFCRWCPHDTYGEGLG